MEENQIEIERISLSSRTSRSKPREKRKYHGATGDNQKNPGEELRNELFVQSHDSTRKSEGSERTATSDRRSPSHNNGLSKRLSTPSQKPSRSGRDRDSAGQSHRTNSRSNLGQHSDSRESLETNLAAEIHRVEAGKNSRSPSNISTQTSRHSKHSSTRGSRKSVRSATSNIESFTTFSEQGLEEERFPSYLTPGNGVPGQDALPDKQSLYSVQSHSVKQDERATRSPSSSARSPSYISSSTHKPNRGTRVKASTTPRKTKDSGKRASSVSVSRTIDTTEENLSWQEVYRTRADSVTSKTHYTSSNSSHRSPSDQTHHSPLSGQQTTLNGRSKSKSKHGSLSHISIAEESEPYVTSESGVNLQNSSGDLDRQEKLSIRTKRSSSGRGSQLSYSSSSHSNKNELGETDSIGSATSIMLRASSRTSRSSGSHNHVLGDPDEEILVGDEKDLHDAARRGEPEIVEQLLELGTDVNCRNETDRTPIHWAAGNGHSEVLKILLERDINIDAADKFGMNALLWASWFGHKNCVQMLLRAGAKATSKNKNGYTFLHCAAQNNHIMAESILSEDLQEFDRNLVDDVGRTCLHVLAKYGHKEMLEKFIALHCDISAKDKANNTPLHLAAKYGSHSLLSVLVNAGANLEDKNSESKTALHLAAEEGRLEAVEELINLGADVNAETEDEVGPLHLAISAGREEVAHMLVSNGADMDAGNKHNQTPLHYAVFAKKPTIVEILTTHGADSNVQDARQETPLHLSAENGYREIADILLHSDINLALTDQRGKTALNVAARGSYITIVDMIIKAERHYLYLKSVPPMHLETNGNSYVATQRSYQDTTDGIPPVSFKPDNNGDTQHIRQLLYKLATKYLKKDEWRKLAFQWGFTDSQVQAIEEQYTGHKSYHQHGYRMLLIWLNGCTLRGENPVRSLFEGLVAIQRRDVAETIRTKANALPADKSCVVS